MGNKSSLGLGSLLEKKESFLFHTGFTGTLYSKYLNKTKKLLSFCPIEVHLLGDKEII